LNQDHHNNSAVAKQIVRDNYRALGSEHWSRANGARIMRELEMLRNHSGLAITPKTSNR